jgi:hypothetical protein
MGEQPLFEFQYQFGQINLSRRRRYHSDAPEVGKESSCSRSGFAVFRSVAPDARQAGTASQVADESFELVVVQVPYREPHGFQPCPKVGSRPQAFLYRSGGELILGEGFRKTLKERPRRAGP